jgi:tetratricopeptide (TPR) repeat protein
MAAEPIVSSANVRAEAQRQERAVRAMHRRELRRNPEKSQPHAWIAYDMLRDLLDRAQQAMPVATPRSNAPMSEFSRQRQAFDQRQILLEKYVAQKLQQDARQAVRHAEKAFLYAATPMEEMQARRVLGDAYRFAGRYEDAIRQFRWLNSVEPFGDRGMLVRCFIHKGQQIRWENRGGDYWAIVGVQALPIGMRSAEPFIEATRKWARRWPDSSVVRSRLGNFYYSLALQKAMEVAEFPKPGKEFGKRVDACIYRHSRPEVEEGVRHFETALKLAATDWERARALTELGHGHLIAADYNRAIPLLREALAIEPWNRTAQDYLRQAFRRRGTGQERVVTAMRPPPGWYTEMGGMPSVNNSVTGYGIGFGYWRLSIVEADEANHLIARLERPAVDTDPRRRQEERNRLDEILPGIGRRYHPSTGDVLTVDLEHASARLERLRRLGAIYAPTRPGR